MRTSCLTHVPHLEFAPTFFVNTLCMCFRSFWWFKNLAMHLLIVHSGCWYWFWEILYTCMSRTARIWNILADGFMLLMSLHAYLCRRQTKKKKEKRRDMEGIIDWSYYSKVNICSDRSITCSCSLKCNGTVYYVMLWLINFDDGNSSCVEKLCLQQRHACYFPKS